MQDKMKVARNFFLLEETGESTSNQDLGGFKLPEEPITGIVNGVVVREYSGSDFAHEGDRVLFSKSDSREIKAYGKKYYLTEEKYIFVILEK